MKVVKSRNLFLFGFLGLFLLFSCSKKDDGGDDGPIQHADANNYYEYTVSGAVSGTVIGKPTWIMFGDVLGSLIFSNDDHQLKFTGNNKYRDETEKGHHMIGIERVTTENGRWVAKLGTYPVTPFKIMKHNSSEVSFYVYYKDGKSGKKFGSPKATDGKIIITASDKTHYEGTFEFEAFEVDGPANSSIKIKGKFRMPGGY